ncbi:hypothetical protein D3C87_1249800 [compost metagenome]
MLVRFAVLAKSWRKHAGNFVEGERDTLYRTTLSPFHAMGGQSFFRAVSAGATKEFATSASLCRKNGSLTRTRCPDSWIFARVCDSSKYDQASIGS